MSASPKARLAPNHCSIPLRQGAWMTINAIPTDGGFLGEGRVWVKEGSDYTPHRIPKSEVFDTKEKALEDTIRRGRSIAG